MTEVVMPYTLQSRDSTRALDYGTHERRSTAFPDRVVWLRSVGRRRHLADHEFDRRCAGST